MGISTGDCVSTWMLLEQSRPLNNGGGVLGGIARRAVGAVGQPLRIGTQGRCLMPAAPHVRAIGSRLAPQWYSATRAPSARCAA